jgi:hypothetical protein
MYFRLRTTRYAHALPSRTPKDTLLTLNTLPEPSHDDSLLVLGLVLRHPASHPFSRLTVAGTGIRIQMRITQSISLSNIHLFCLRKKARPEAVETCRTALKG